MVETVRNEHGLALSSRNKRLGPLSLQAATSIYTSFRKIKAQYQSESFSNLCSRETAFLLENGFESVEYLAITDRTSLTESDSFSSKKQYIIIAAAWIEGVRAASSHQMVEERIKLMIKILFMVFSSIFL